MEGKNGGREEGRKEKRSWAREEDLVIETQH